MKNYNLNIHSSEHIILTGAGFTKNFGGLLASEMWAIIFNHKKIQDQPKIKKLMMDDFDFESIYYRIMEGSYSDDEKEAITDAVKLAYENIDAILRKYDFGNPYPIRHVLELFWHFAETSDKSLIFTLNQDLFFERLYSGDKLSIPGIENNSEWFTSYYRKKLEESDNCKLPDEEKLNSIKPDILSDGSNFVIKLHGSYNWKSYDGSDIMIIGRGKTGQIQKEPLLNYYFEVFEKALSQNQRRLLIIGYGFGDDHINNIISDAVRNHGLKIYVISPNSPRDFKNKLLKKNTIGEDIWQGLSGYFSSTLEDIFPENPSEETQEKRNLFDVFFEPE